MPLLTSLLLLLVASRLLGELMTRIKQPAVVGEIIAGVILGPAVLSLIAPTEALSAIAELAVFLVVLSAGLEMNFSEVVTALKDKAVLVAAFGFLVPLFSGILLGILFGLTISQTVFLGLCFSITALPVAVRILEGMKLLDHPLSHDAIGTAIIIDVAALLALGVILDLPDQKDFLSIASSIGETGGKMIFFAVLVFLFNKALRWTQNHADRVRIGVENVIHALGNEALFGVAVLFVLVFSSISESLGFHFVIGAFFGALLLNKDIFGSPLFHSLDHTLSSVTDGFLAPIFFAYIGLQFQAGELQSPLFVVLVIVVAIASKILACSFAAKLTGMPKLRGAGIGMVLNSRGVMDLVVADIALHRGFITKEIFSVLVLLGVVSTLLTPLLLKRFILPKLNDAPAEPSVS